MSAAPKPHPSSVVSLEDAPARLAELGLTVQMLQRSIEVGDSKKQMVAHPVFPKTYPGVVMWAETLAELRRQLLKRRVGWAIGETQNYATVYAEDSGIAVAVVAGDGGVGRENLHPRPTRKKGKKTRQRIHRNARQLYIQDELALEFPAGTPEKKELPPDEACQTWFLLINATKKEVRIELSCPLEITEDGIVYGWLERIMLPPVAIAGAVAPMEPDDDDDGYDGGDEPLVGR